jgi:hypothetical protein
MEKATVKELVLQAIKDGHRTPAKIHETLGGDKRSQVYTAISKLRASGVVTKTPDGFYLSNELPLNKTKAKRKYTRTAPNKHDSMVALGKEILKGRKVVGELIDANKYLSGKIEELNNTITALKIDMLDQQAIINYLEKKLYK